MKLKIYQTKSGLVHDETFEDLDDWEVKNPSCATTNNNQLTLTHCDKDTYIIRPFDESVGIVEYDIDYTPQKEGDAGGVLLYNSSDHHVEVLEVADKRKLDLGKARIKRTPHEDGHIIVVEMEREGRWELIDTFTGDYRYYGVISKKGESSFEPVVVDRITAVKENYLTVEGLPFGFSASLEGVKSEEADDDGKVFIALKDLSSEGTLTIYDEVGAVVGEREGIFYGGDSWKLGTYLQVMRDGKELDKFEPERLGRVTNNLLEVQLDLVNPTTTTAKHIALALKEYDKDGKQISSSLDGLEWVHLAEDEDGFPSNNLVKVLEWERLGGEEERPFWIVIKKEDSATDFSTIFFSLSLVHN